MSSEPQSELTRVLARVRAGEQRAVEELFGLAYDQLRGLAAKQLRGERVGHTLQATALVNEAYLRLADRTEPDWESRSHFFAAAAQAIRRILVDHARAKRAEKRGGNRRRVPLDATLLFAEPRDIDLLALDDALNGLAHLNERQARIVELRYFGGLNMPEIAKLLGKSLRTVEGDWSMARTWLKDQLTDRQPD